MLSIQAKVIEPLAKNREGGHKTYYKQVYLSGLPRIYSASCCCWMHDCLTIKIIIVFLFNSFQPFTCRLSRVHDIRVYFVFTPFLAIHLHLNHLRQLLCTCDKKTSKKTRDAKVPCCYPSSLIEAKYDLRNTHVSCCDRCLRCLPFLAVCRRGAPVKIAF